MSVLIEWEKERVYLRSCTYHTWLIKNGRSICGSFGWPFIRRMHRHWRTWLKSWLTLLAEIRWKPNEIEWISFCSEFFMRRCDVSTLLCTVHRHEQIKKNWKIVNRDGWSTENRDHSLYMAHEKQPNCHTTQNKTVIDFQRQQRQQQQQIERVSFYCSLSCSVCSTFSLQTKTISAAIRNVCSFYYSPSYNTYQYNVWSGARRPFPNRKYNRHTHSAHTVQMLSRPYAVCSMRTTYICYVRCKSRVRSIFGIQWTRFATTGSCAFVIFLIFLFILLLFVLLSFHFERVNCCRFGWCDARHDIRVVVCRRE